MVLAGSKEVEDGWKDVQGYLRGSRKLKGIYDGPIRDQRRSRYVQDGLKVVHCGLIDSSEFKRVL